jgi:hypothetical protein
VEKPSEEDRGIWFTTKTCAKCGTTARIKHPVAPPKEPVARSNKPETSILKSKFKPRILEYLAKSGRTTTSDLARNLGVAVNNIWWVCKNSAEIAMVGTVKSETSHRIMMVWDLTPAPKEGE